MPRRSPSSSRWLRRQGRDAYVKRRHEQGYRSRAAFKLLEINRRDRLIAPGARVLDLGASPGGWTQVASAASGRRGTVVAVDVLKMEPVAGATFIEGDFREPEVRARAAQALGAAQADLVMSDMAPNISGIAARDEAAADELARMVLDFTRENLRGGGALLVKLFECEETVALLGEMEGMFAEVSRRKPDASRSRSREFYVVAKGFGI